MDYGYTDYWYFAHLIKILNHYIKMKKSYMIFIFWDIMFNDWLNTWSLPMLKLIYHFALHDVYGFLSFTHACWLREHIENPNSWYIENPYYWYLLRWFCCILKIYKFICLKWGGAYWILSIISFKLNIFLIGIFSTNWYFLCLLNIIWSWCI